MKSHEPFPTMRSMSATQMRRAVGVMRSTAAGENQLLSTWRYLTWSGGFTSVGMNRYAGSGSSGSIESLENTSWRWYASRTSS